MKYISRALPLVFLTCAALYAAPSKSASNANSNTEFSDPQNDASQFFLTVQSKKDRRKNNRPADSKSSLQAVGISGILKQKENPVIDKKIEEKISRCPSPEVKEPLVVVTEEEPINPELLQAQIFETQPTGFEIVEVPKIPEDLLTTQIIMQKTGSALQKSQQIREQEEVLKKEKELALQALEKTYADLQEKYKAAQKLKEQKEKILIENVKKTEELQSTVFQLAQVAQKKLENYMQAKSEYDLTVQENENAQKEFGIQQGFTLKRQDSFEDHTTRTQMLKNELDTINAELENAKRKTEAKPDVQETKLEIPGAQQVVPSNTVSQASFFGWLTSLGGFH